LTSTVRIIIDFPDPGLDDEAAYELASQVVRDLAARYPDAHMASYIGTPHMED
jgi:hypothetical protein